jgi:YceI-like domain
MRFVTYYLIIALLGCVPALSFASTDNWVLDHSTVTYSVNHPLKTASATSKGARGNGQCNNKGKCDFLIAVPVKSFESGDSNRDLHMLQVTRGAANPMVIMRSSIDESSLGNDPVLLTVNIEFAGKKAIYQKVPFKAISNGEGRTQLRGTIVIKLDDFAITPPSLLTMSIKNDVPIDVDAYWKKTGK